MGVPGRLPTVLEAAPRAVFFNAGPPTALTMVVVAVPFVIADGGGEGDDGRFLATTTWWWLVVAFFLLGVVLDTLDTFLVVPPAGVVGSFLDSVSSWPRTFE